MAEPGAGPRLGPRRCPEAGPAPWGRRPQGGLRGPGRSGGRCERERRLLGPEARRLPSCAAPSDRRGRCGRAGLGSAAPSLTPLAGSPWRPRSCFAACAEHGPRSARRPRSCCGPRGAGTGSRRPTTSCTSGRTSPCCSARPPTPPTSTATAPAASWSTGTACSGPARCSRTPCCSGTSAPTWTSRKKASLSSGCWSPR